MGHQHHWLEVHRLPGASQRLVVVDITAVDLAYKRFFINKIKKYDKKYPRQLRSGSYICVSPLPLRWLSIAIAAPPSAVGGRNTYVAEDQSAFVVRKLICM